MDAGTGNVRLRNLTTAATIAMLNVTATVQTLHKMLAVALTDGVNEYELQAQRGTTWIRVWGARMTF